ncbi:hypothetical protein K9B33_11510 [Sphingobium sp. 3R8]|uniref:hypothetical protein n=1 Tax=Sphingobium sp. 3R8 TaxID=2874921 RepID=UPI001CCA38DE|nr:hypothetical protein [Sphingobium sp. 3R8]MBZ9648177.1 hypothetical protein [Sphingobium sp. 3R8]
MALFAPFQASVILDLYARNHDAHWSEPYAQSIPKPLIASVGLCLSSTANAQSLKLGQRPIRLAEQTAAFCNLVQSAAWWLCNLAQPR